MKPSGIVAGALLAATSVQSASAASHAGAHVANVVIRDNLQVPSQAPVPNAYRSQGCYKSKGNMTSETVENVSSGSCNDACSKDKYWVSALQGSQCYCGFAYPSADDLSKDANCNYPCPAYGKEACGSLGQPGYFSVWNTGVNVNPPIFSNLPSTTPGASKTPDPNDPNSTPSASASSAPQKSGPNVAGIAAGSVAGVVVFAGLAGVAAFFIKRRRNAEIEEEHRRNAAVNAFINGSKPPSDTGSISMTDSRLDPVMAHRRLSDGSIADNQDYSRRILRVTNA